MRSGLLMALMLASGASWAQVPWFTVSGDPERADVDTVQVDPVAVDIDGPHRAMNLRVNRAAPRTSWDGVPYRSYEAVVQFHCEARRAEYRRIAYFAEPLWRGEAARRVEYRDNPPPMLFRDAQPNPTERIVRAACGR